MADCSECGDETDEICCDCVIEFDEAVYVCPDMKCRSRHEERDPDEHGFTSYASVLGKGPKGQP